MKKGEEILRISSAPYMEKSGFALRCEGRYCLWNLRKEFRIPIFTKGDREEGDKKRERNSR